MSSDSEHLIPVSLCAEVARRLGIGRSLAYELIAAGELEVVHVASVMRVPVDAVHALSSGAGPSSRLSSADQ